MMYLGGKFRQGKKIAEVLSSYMKSGGRYVEPFCGALWSACAVAKIAPKNTKMILSDKNEALGADVDGSHGRMGAADQDIGA